MEKVSIQLDNAQSGGPKVCISHSRVTRNEGESAVVGTIYLGEGAFVSFDSGTMPIELFPASDGIEIAEIIVADKITEKARNLLDFLRSNCGESEKSLVELKCNGEDSDIYGKHLAQLIQDLEDCAR